MLSITLLRKQVSLDKKNSLRRDAFLTL